jgi:hypothetical protein
MFNYSVFHFNEAHRYYEKIMSLIGNQDWKYAKLFKLIDALCQQYGKLKDDNELLATEKVLEIVMSHHWRFLHIRMINYSIVQSKDRAEKLVLVRALIKIFNPLWEGQKSLEYSADVTFTGRNLKTIAYYGNCFIKKISITKLDISQTGISDLKELSTANFVSLDIRSLKVKNVNSLMKVRRLKTLIVHPGQLSEEEVLSLTKKITVIEQP